MGGPDSVTQTTETSPPDYLLPFLKDSANVAQKLMGRGPMSYYSGNTVVPFSPQTNQALNLQQNRALSGSPVLNSAQGFTQNLLAGNSPLNQDFSGGPIGSAPLSQFTPDNYTAFTGGPTGESFLSPFMNQNNPYLDATFNKAAGAVNRNLDTILARSGRDLHGNLGARSDALNNLATDIYGGAYENDRSRALSAASQLSGQVFTGGQSDLGRQQQASESARDRALNAGLNLSGQIFSGGQSDIDRRLQAASTLGGQQLAASTNAIPLSREDYFDISQLGNVGAQTEQQAQNIIQDQLNRYNFAQEAPYASLDRFISQISGMPMGQQTSSSQPVFRSPIAGALGGVSAAAGLGGMMAAPGATGLAAVGGLPMLLGGGLLGLLGS
jgi:hypothetical protein